MYFAENLLFSDQVGEEKKGAYEMMCEWSQVREIKIDGDVS